MIASNLSSEAWVRNVIPLGDGLWVLLNLWDYVNHAIDIFAILITSLLASLCPLGLDNN